MNRSDEGISEESTDVRFYLHIQYDGTHFFGWQVQPDARTVQGEIEAALERLTGAHRTLLGSGRTDRGVHALGQVAAVTLPSRWTARELQRALRAVLPDEIRVDEVRTAAPEFHPRYDALSRRYRYFVGTTPASRSPFVSPFCWPSGDGAQPVELDLEAMNRCSDRLVGSHSFLAFAKSGQPERGDRCEVFEAGWSPWGSTGIAFEIVADRFLHHMVRYLVGTLVDIGRESRPEGDLEALLRGDSGKHLITSPPAPAKGLYLTEVRYPDSVFGPAGPPSEPGSEWAGPIEFTRSATPSHDSGT